ncbi:hypothetical protein ONZ45_g11388 [Pleurotus djamor]|nr:hypothetical protein ONZ45_g11388 [Pleurotus djamor]
MDSPSRVPSPSRPIRSSPLPSPEAPVTEARWSPGPIPGSSQPVWSTLDVRASSSPSTSECDTEDQGTSPFFDDEEEVDELESSRQVSPIPHATDDVSMEMDVDGAPDLGTLAAESSPVLHDTSPFEDTAHTISNAKPLESSPTSPAPLPSSSALHPPSSAFPPPPKRPRTSFTPNLFDRALTLRQCVSSRQSETPDLTHHSPASANTPSSSTKGLETTLGKLIPSTSPPSTSSCLHTPDTPLSPPHIPLETFESDPDNSNPPWMMEDIDGSEMDLSEMHLFYPDD